MSCCRPATPLAAEPQANIENISSYDARIDISGTVVPAAHGAWAETVAIPQNKPTNATLRDKLDFTTDTRLIERLTTS